MFQPKLLSKSLSTRRSQFSVHWMRRKASWAILLRRPQGWCPTALGELHRVLAQHDFDPVKLQRAHERASHKALAGHPVFTYSLRRSM
jgi:hypothetical protein